MAVFELEKITVLPTGFSFIRPYKHNFGLIVIPYFPVVLLELSTVYVTVTSEINFLLFSILQHSLTNITTFTVILVSRCFR